MRYPNGFYQMDNRIFDRGIKPIPFAVYNLTARDLPWTPTPTSRPMLSAKRPTRWGMCCRGYEGKQYEDIASSC